MQAGSPSTVKGIGVDAVDIERFRLSLQRTPSMRQRLFTAEELDYVAPKADPVPSLAARFAAREAVMKAMGLGLGAFGFHEVWVSRAGSGEPSSGRSARPCPSGQSPKQIPRSRAVRIVSLSSATRLIPRVTCSRGT